MLITATLPAHLAVSVVSLAGAADGVIQIAVVCSRPAAPCPVCGRAATRVHSRYTRTVADLPWQRLAARVRSINLRMQSRAPSSGATNTGC